MNEKPRSSSCFVLAVSVPISFVLGLIFGLVVLGWWLWPVEWTGGDLSMLAPGDQMDYLSAAVSSYAYNQDAQQAQARFANLGENRNAALIALYTAEPQSADLIRSFAGAVGAMDVLTAPPSTEAVAAATEPAAATAEPGAIVEPTSEAAQASTPLIARLLSAPVRLLAGVCVGLLVLVALLLLIVAQRNRSQKRRLETVQGEPPTGEPLAGEPPTNAYSGYVTSAEEPETGVTGAEPLPDWLDLAETGDEYQTIRLGESDLAAPTVESATAPAAEPYDELPVSTDEELTDEDIAAITSQDFSKTTTTLGGAVIFGESAPTESIHFPGTAGQVDLEETEPEQDFWLEPAQEPAGEPPQETPAWLEPAPVEELPGTSPLVLLRGDETPQQTEEKFSQDIEAVIGVSAEEAAQLRLAGVSVPLLLLHKGADPDGRRLLAQETGIREDRLLHWVKFVDLFRIKGVDLPAAELLYALGVQDVPSLAASAPEGLYQEILAASQSGRFDRETISPQLVRAWVEQAKRLPRAVVE